LTRKLARILLSVEWEGGFIHREKLAFKNQLRYGKVTVLYMFCGETAAESASAGSVSVRISWGSGAAPADLSAGPIYD
tara:strand:+ start:66 stop:299 length:234 start_codon:yes stop_codon:yes gene_type:complete